MDSKFIVSALVEDLEDPVIGSVQEECYRCHKPAWVSPATRKYAGKDVRIVCLHCYVAYEMEENPDREIMPLTPAQKREIWEAVANERRN